jgi:predicted nucleic acid-binding Zn ribbon protein
VSAGPEPSRVGDLVERFLAQKGLKRQVARLEVLGNWPDVVGQAVADVTRARSVSGGALIVEVRSSAWLMELDLMKGRILEAVNRDRDEDARIDKLVFVLAEGAEPDSPRGTR